MRGHIRRRGDKWVAVVDVGRKNGKRLQKWTTFDTEKEAHTGLTTILKTLDEAAYVTPSKITVERYMRDVWFPNLEDRVAIGDLRPTTVAFYRQLAEGHVFPNLGNEKLQMLTAPMLNRLYADLRRSGRRGGGKTKRPGLSTTTVRGVATTISACLAYAVAQGDLPRNVAKMAKPPQREDREAAVWTVEQTFAFLEATKNDRLHPLYLLAVTTGMRRGELCGLRWQDVDLDGDRVTVAQARVAVGYAVVESGPKTRKGRRCVAIAPSVSAVLRAHRVRQSQERLAWGPAWIDTGLVFTKQDGTGYHPLYVTSAFQRAAKRAKLPVLPLHSLRHHHATSGLRAGIDLVTMSKRLGHSSTSVTSDIYQHVVAELDREAAEKTAALLSSPPGQAVGRG